MKTGILKVLMQEMADITLPECKNSCNVPLSCCDPLYCEITKTFAKDFYNIDLVETGHPKLPYMSETGCTIEPHLRPICTMHTCAVGSLGYKPNDVVWTTNYFQLRDRIDELLQST